jgi:hypothetical protein
MCEDFTPNLGNKITGCCIETTHRLTFPFFIREFCTKNDRTVVPHPLYSPSLDSCDFSLSPPLKIKLKGRHFNTTEVIEAGSHAVLSTFTEHDFQDTLKMAEALQTVQKRGR